MHLMGWLKEIRSSYLHGRVPRCKRRGPRHLFQIEALEDRCCPTPVASTAVSGESITFYATDPTGNGFQRSEIAAAPYYPRLDTLLASIAVGDTRTYEALYDSGVKVEISKSADGVAQILVHFKNEGSSNPNPLIFFESPQIQINFKVDFDASEATSPNRKDVYFYRNSNPTSGNESSQIGTKLDSESYSSNGYVLQTSVANGSNPPVNSADAGVSKRVSAVVTADGEPNQGRFHPLIYFYNYANLTYKDARLATNDGTKAADGTIQVFAGQPILLEAQVTNMGTSSTQVSTLFSSNLVSPLGSVLQSQNTSVATLAAGASQSVSREFSTTDLAPGRYRVSFTVDSTNLVLERDEIRPTVDQFDSDKLTSGGNQRTYDSNNTAIGSHANSFVFEVKEVPNTAPVIVIPERQNATEDTPMTFSSALSVSDQEATTMAVTLSVSHGTLTLANISGLIFSGGANGGASFTVTGSTVNLNTALATLSYLPGANYNGPDSLTATVSDLGASGSGGTLTDTKAVGISVAAVNDPPSVILPGLQSTAEDSPLTIPPLVVSDLDSSSLSVTLSVSHGTVRMATVPGVSFTSGSNGSRSFTITGTISDLNTALGTMTYTPDLNYNGADRLAVNVSDSGSPTPEVATGISVTPVNDAPSMSTQGPQETLEDTAKLIPALIVSDVDASSLAVTLSASYGKVTLGTLAGLTILGGSNGTASITVLGTISSLNAALNTISYLPNVNYSGPDGIIATVSDLGATGAGGALSDEKVIPLTVTAVNDPPSITVPGQLSTLEDAPSLPIPPITVADVDSTTLDVALSVSHGNLSFSGLIGITFVVGGNGSRSIVLRGTPEDLNAALETLRYSPDADFNGADSLTTSVSDSGETGPSGAPPTPGTPVAIEVAPVNDAPRIFTPSSASTSEDTPTEITGITVSDIDATELSLTLTVAQGTLTLPIIPNLTFTGGANGSSSFTVSGPVAALNTALGHLSYTPKLNYSGPDSLTSQVSDLGASGVGGTLTTTGAAVSIAVTAVNDPPLIQTPAMQTTAEDTAKPISGISVSDVDASSLSVMLSVSHGSLTLGTTTGLTFSDGVNGNASFTVTGLVSNLNAALSTLIYLPTSNFNGSDVLTTSVSDQGETGTGGSKLTPGAPVAIVISPVNDAPSISELTENMTPEDTVKLITPISVSDVDATTLTVSLSVSHGTLTLGTVTGLTFDGANGTKAFTVTGTVDNLNAALATIYYRPDDNYNGSDELALTVSDLGNTGSGGILTASKSLPLTITPVNDPPTLAVPNRQVVLQAIDTSITLISTADVDTAILEVTLTASQGTLTLGTTHGLTFTNGGNGQSTITVVGLTSDLNDALATLRYRSNLTFIGDDQITVAVSDHVGAGTPAPEPVTGSIPITVVSQPPGIDLTKPDGTFTRIISSAELGSIFSTQAGDFDGDGFDDVLVGAPYAADGLGRAFIVLWSPDRTSPVDLSAPDNRVISIVGLDQGDGAARSSTGVGDVNGDGFDDILIAAFSSDSVNDSRVNGGECYVIFGRSQTVGAINVNNLGSGGTIIYGADAGDELGRDLSSGDINGDGYRDLILGARRADGPLNERVDAGETYVVFGAPALPATIDLASLGNRGMVVSGAEGLTSPNDFGDQSAVAVGSADFNGDGYDDLIIGAYRADGINNTRHDAGETYVVFGSANPPQSLDLATLGSRGVTVVGAFESNSGISVAGVGDVNGDGFEDIMIGATDFNGLSNEKQNAGESYLIFGSANSPQTIDATNLGSAGIRIVGADPGDRFGRDVTGGIDLNGDGFDDIVVAARYADTLNNSTPAAGDVYVLFGRTSFASLIDLSQFGSADLTIWGTMSNSKLGTTLDGVGDVNGDGFDDFVASELTGTNYVIFGRDFSNVVTRPGTSANDNLTGTPSRDVMISAQGADTISGSGGQDVLRGGEGDDKLIVGDTTFGRVAGGNGVDTLLVQGAGLRIDLSTIANSRLSDIEQIDIRGTGANTLLLNYQEVVNLSSHSNRVLVRAGLDDTVIPGTGWTLADIQTIDSVSYAIYQQGAAVLGIEYHSPTVTLTIDSTNIAETAGTATLTATLSTVSIQDVTVSLNVSGNALRGVDYSLPSLQIVIPAGATSASLTINATSDSAVEGNESVVIAIDTVTNATKAAAPDVNAIIIDDDFSNPLPPSILPDQVYLVPENSSPGTLVGRPDATDADSPPTALQNWTIVAGNADWDEDGVKAFAINPVTGTITVADADELDRERLETYILTLTVSDGSLTSAPQSVAVRLSDVNEFTPEIGSLTASVQENSVNGTIVGQVVGFDRDAAAGLSYRIVSGNEAGLFAINPSTGQIRVADTTKVDREIVDSVSMIIEVSDNGPGAPRSNQANVTVNIIGINDNTPQFTSESFIGIPENTIQVVTLKASDADLPSQTIQFSIEGGEDRLRFEIVNNILQFKTAPDFEAPSDVGGNNVYLVQVMASDGAGRSTTQNLSVTVTGVNDSKPLFTSAATTSITENSTNVLTVTATDADLPTQTITYLLTGGMDQAKFTITIGGTLSFLAAPDFESPSDSNSDNVYMVQVTASDGAGGSTVQNLSVTVTGVNDNSPTFTSTATPSVLQNMTSVLTVTATDADLPAQTVTFSLTGGVDRAKFTITTGGELAFLAPPQLTNPTDSNGDNIYLVQVTASDGAGRTTVQDLSVTILAVANNPPLFTSTATPTISENTTGVITVAATDTDLPAQVVTYSLTGGADQGKFAITPSGALSFLTAPDFESPADSNSDNVYLVQVMASDGTGGTTIQNLSVTVTGVNDNNPTFTSTATLGVLQNTTNVLTVMATDADLPAQAVTFSLTGGADQARFAISATGLLTFLTPPQFASPTDSNGDNIYLVQVTASDGAGRTTFQNLSISVLAAPNSSPSFTSTATPTISENTISVLTIMATDTDLPAQTITFSLTGGADQAKFTITSEGVLSFLTAPDFENPTDSNTNNVYLVHVTASDGVGGVSVQTLSVTVTGVNDHSPSFTSTSNLNVPENSTSVLTVAAIDADLPTQAITYSLTGGADQAKFTITTDGLLSFLTAPDFESPSDFNADNVYLVQVTASDGAGGTTAQNLSITVTGINDNNPSFTSTATPSIPENSTNVITISATDADQPAQTITYSLTGGADREKFTITAGGILTFNAPPDFESPGDSNGDNLYLVQVTADDGSGKTAVQDLPITVTGLNDNDPLFKSISVITVVEGTTSLLTVIATDTDLPAQTLTYSLDGGPDQGRLAITTEGALSFLSAPDFSNPTDSNADNVYMVDVTAHDGAGRATTQSIAVIVTNGAPTVSAIAAQTILEDTATGVLSFTIGDPGSPANNLTVTATSSNAGLIPNANIVITGTGANRGLAITPAANNSGSSTITVTVSDGTLSTIQTFQVVVQPVDDPTLITLSSQPLVYVSNRKIVTVDSSATISDADNPNLVFGGSSLVVSGIQAKDRLSILKLGEISRRGKKVLAGNTVIGTLSGGKRGAPLSIAFNSSATQSSVQALLRSIGFKSTDKVAGNRVLRFQIVDIGTQDSNQATRQIQVGL